MHEQLAKIHRLISESTNPLFLFDDDVDGLTSYLLLYKHFKKGRNRIIKSSPVLKTHYAIDSEGHDLFVILDKPQIEEGFMDAVSCPVVWIDHHDVVDAVGITYFNPKKYELESFPTSYWCYQLTQSDEWLAVLGCVSDWQLPDVVKTFIKANKKLFPRKTTDPGEILYNSTFGRLIQSLTFNLVGPSKEVSLSLSAIRKIQSLQELLDATTESAAFIKQRADKTANVYFQILAEIVKTIKRQKLVVYIYPENTTSFTGELSNELQYRYPKKVILIGRNREGQYRCSIRSKEHDLPAVLSRALVGISGYGGGHTNACGLCVDANDWDRFLVVLKEELKK